MTKDVIKIIDTENSDKKRGFSPLYRRHGLPTLPIKLENFPKTIEHTYYYSVIQFTKYAFWLIELWTFLVRKINLLPNAFPSNLQVS